MKIILLLLGILIFLSKKNAVKGLFKSKDQRQEELETAFNKIDIEFAKDKDIAKGIAFVFGILLVLLYVLFYILSAVYIPSFIFTIVSIALIIWSFKDLGNFIKQISDKKYLKAGNRIKTLINIVVDFSYIGYVFYNVFLRF